MTRRLGIWGQRLVLLGMSGWLFQAGCARVATQELEVLFASAASPALVSDSILVSLLGPTFLQLLSRL
jgi:hypothetical protein